MKASAPGLRIAMIGSRGMPARLGGIERAVEELASGLAERGHPVTVYCRPGYCEARPPSYRGVQLCYVPCPATKHLETATHSLLSTLHALGTGFDVLHFHGIGPSMLAPLARASRRVTVVTVQGLDWDRAKWGPMARRVLRLAERLGTTSAHRVILVSRTLLTHFSQNGGLHAERFAYIPNGVRVPEPPPGADTLARFGLRAGNYVLYLGRLVPEKRCEDLIVAFKTLPGDVHLVIAGDHAHTGGYADTLRQLAAGDRRIVFTGPLFGAAKAEMFAHAALFAHPSELEGLAISVLEAMAYGRAVLVSDIPENREIVAPNSTDAPRFGFTFRVRDRDHLRAQLAALLARPEELQRVGTLARQHVRDAFAWDRIVGETEALYLRALGGGDAK